MALSTSAFRTHRAEWAVVALAVGVRVSRLIALWDNPLHFNDAYYYSELARQPWLGRWFRELIGPLPSAEHVPLPTLLFSTVSWMDHYVPWQRSITVLTGIALVAVLVRCGAEVGGRRTGLAAGLIAAVYPNLWLNDGLVMSESISMLLVALSIWAAWRALTDDRRWAMARWGLAMGLGVLSRSEVALVALLLVVAVGIARRRAGRGLLPMAVALAVSAGVVAPWVGYNLVRFERPVLLSTNDGTTWAGANCDATYYSEVLGGWTIVCVANHQGGDGSVRSAQLKDDAVTYARAHLRRVPVVVAARIARTLDLYGFADMVRVDEADERPARAVWSGIVSFWVLVPLAVFGWWRSRRRVRVLFGLPVVSVLVTAAVFYGAHRIRSSAEPSLVVFAAVGALAFVDRLRRRDAVSGPGRG